MQPLPQIVRKPLAALLLAVIATSGVGCGLIADTGRIVVATLDGKKITRGDLEKLIYNMPNDKRDIIRSRKDYLRVLNRYIDSEIKIPLGAQLADEGKIKVDRNAAREQFFKESGDKEEEYRLMWSTPVPKPGEETELMKAYNLQAVDIQAMKNIIEQETDRIVEREQGDEAVRYLAVKALKAGELTLDPEDLKMEYELGKKSMKTFESISFLGLQFPASAPRSSTEASGVRARLDNGEEFDRIMAEYIQRDSRFGIDSEIENNPALKRFQLFWEQVSGAGKGDILGPVYMPEYARARRDAGGKITQQIMPASYLVFKVTEHHPSRTLTFEEAKPAIMGPIAFAEMMEKLRDEHGVKIFENKLPDVRGGSRDIFEN